MKTQAPDKTKLVYSAMTEQPICFQEIIEFVSDEEHGAVAAFMGTVRKENYGRIVTAITYEAFRPLAHKMLEEIALNVHQRWNTKVSVIHRIGHLSVGEITVAVAASATHRNESIDAVSYMIGQIKNALPIFKKEHYTNGESIWLDGHSLSNEKWPGGHRKVSLPNRFRSGI